MEDVSLLLENTSKSWLLAFFVGISVWFGLMSGRKLLVRKLGALSKHGFLYAILYDVIAKTQVYFILVLALFAAFKCLEVSPLINAVLDKGLKGGAIIQIGFWLHYLSANALNESHLKAAIESRLAKGAVQTVESILRILLWSLIFIFLLGNLGFDIGPLIAGLGIGGIAIALGIQNTLKDIAASISIIIDKPFMAGDFIMVDSFMGTVERIGIKTTRLCSLGGEQIVFSNDDLLKSRIRNYKKMDERRILFSFNVPYDTPYEKVQNIPEMVKRIIMSQKMVRFDRAHLKKFGVFAFEYEVVYYVLASDYNVYMNAQHAINLSIIQQFEDQGIAFAIPKHDVVFKPIDSMAQAP